MKILSTGIDIVEVERVKSIYSRYGRKFLNKVLTPEEIEKLGNKNKAFYQSLAARIAAKEAVYKALNSYHLGIKPSWKDIKIESQENGSPFVSLNFELNPKINIVLSLSHTDNYAVANALLIEE
jgi:holo-[acyl-carrier protein] synthase